MPTTVTSSIGTAARDYSTIQAWEDACPANLVTDDKVWKGECHNDSTFTAYTTIGGITADSTRYVWLTCAAGKSFQDNSNIRTTPLDVNSANGVAIITTVDGGGFSLFIDSVEHCHIDGLQIHANIAYDLGAVYFQSVVNGFVTGCILKANQNYSVFGSGGSTIFRNCLCITTANGDANPLSGGSGAFDNCTFVSTTGTGTNWRSNGNASIAKNCASFGFADNVINTLDATSNYLATDLADNTDLGGGANNLLSLTYADQFESVTNDFRLKAGHSLKAGTPDANVLTDISGYPRDATTPCIGCWEASSARRFLLH